jgi:hypothetical protein
MTEWAANHVADAKHQLRERKHLAFLKSLDSAFSLIDADDWEIVAALAGEGMALLSGKSQQEMRKPI